MKKILLIALLITLSGCNYDNIVEVETQRNYSGEYQTSLQNIETIILYISHDGKMSLSGTGNWNGLAFNFAGTVMNKHALLTFSLKKTSLGDLEGTIDCFFDNAGMFLAGGYVLRNEYNIVQSAINFRLVSRALYN
ncbi:MAG: hypothetical protein RDU14_04715 [Melioribacteraceae bacterium]|nr:hypothetical protein [Melioribacteraceae bacterium]